MQRSHGQSKRQRQDLNPEPILLTFHCTALWTCGRQSFLWAFPMVGLWFFLSSPGLMVLESSKSDKHFKVPADWSGGSHFLVSQKGQSPCPALWYFCSSLNLRQESPCRLGRVYGSTSRLFALSVYAWVGWVQLGQEYNSGDLDLKKKIGSNGWPFGWSLEKFTKGSGSILWQWV